MFRTESRALVLSVGDLVHAGRCEYAFLREVDRVLGRIDSSGHARLDSAWTKILARGRQHEANVLAAYRREFGRDKVVSIQRPRECSTANLEAAARATVSALQSDASAVYQATIFDGALLGYADFLVRDGESWRVEDAKLTAASGWEARLQVAAYSSVLGKAGIRLAAVATIKLGDGTESAVALDDVVPAFMQSRVRLEELAHSHGTHGHAPVGWNAEGILACGRCLPCREAIESTRDVQLVAGVGWNERAALRSVGITTIDELAASGRSVEGLADITTGRLQRQARLQLQPGELPNVPAFEVARPDLLGSLPAPNAGDLFLSFAAQGQGSDADTEPDHLFAVADVAAVTQTYWGDDREAEAAAFLRFLTDVDARRARHPGMRIYHYSPVDRPHLIDLAERSGAGRDQVEALLASDVLVDLYTIVTGTLAVGTRDHSLREVGRLADPELAQTLAIADVATDRAEYRRLLVGGDLDAASALRSRLERENRERCVLTHRLRDRLLDLLAQHHVAPGSVTPPRRAARARSAVARSLDARAASSANHQLAAAAVAYHPLEASVFWRGHARRRHRHTSEWSTRTRGAARIDLLRIEQDWTEGKRGGATRTLRVRVTSSPGTSFKVDDQPFLVYDGKPLFDDPRATPGQRTATDAMVLQRAGDELIVQERLPKGAAGWRALPAALAPSRPPRTSALEAAVESWAATVLRDEDGSTAASDLAFRRGSRFLGPAPLPVLTADGRLDARASLLNSIEALDRSFVAVQGPPGSGKTTIGAQVIAELVAGGWKIGVVAQSHAVVEHFLERVVAAGAPKGRVAKHVRGDGEPTFTVIGRDRVRTFAKEHDDGYVIGGTAWDLTNGRRFRRGSLDLLVIDEAGQFGLVNAIAVAQAARNLLLLGDPQQIPQISQASHRASADSSALGWLLQGGAVLPEAYGYFLDRTWRMHPALTRAVSDLSYDGQLGAQEATALRRLQGVSPGLHLRPVRHLGNTEASPEEAAEIIRIAQDLVGTAWTPGDGAVPRRLTERDLIVVAPYNAQVDCIKRALQTAGLGAVEVGTVDRFQGREAAVAIYSATVSSLALRPQAVNFVLNRNRLNVAISRAQWAAYIVHSRTLTDFHPRNPADGAALSRFLRLTEFSTSEEAVRRRERPAA